MTFSLIKPEPRPLLSLFSKLWLFLIFVLFLVLFTINLFLIYKNYSIKNKSVNLSQEQVRLSEEIKKLDDVTGILNTKIEVANEIYTSNNLLKQSLHNLFDLVPDSITLEEVLMDKNSLIIRGVTPTKDVFNQLLASPLKSIFTTSNTSFYQIKNGWYGFVSTNKLEKSEGYNE
ncbi:membrane protein [Campylobacter mucosalis]|uniref:hypothetical protein n=1 Tax=Campylobacter mucosalis TaxID=202 RepID=UPI0004D66372|nr:hypothetical protein [Campylobacter mucosalis]KEA46319.1 membrane protein [Campylobacter mucosalis]QKF63205.1 hypothetical protein CMCT_1073 [Campylobacter mucosalis]